MSPEETAASALAGLEMSQNKNRATAVQPSRDAPKPKRRGPKPKVKLAVEPRVIQTIPKRKEYVNHSYSDFSIIPRELDDEAQSNIEDMTFAEKLHDILSDEENSKHIAWRPHGRAFCILVPVQFEKVTCEKYFGHKRYSSFLRQVNNHGFKHISKGVDRNCYYHEVCA
jgi:hypothetical protein